MKKKVIKKHSLALNVNDPEQLEMDEYLSKFTNVSAKLKHLVYMDMRKTAVPGIAWSNDSQMAPSQPQIVEEEEPISSFALDLML